MRLAAAITAILISVTPAIAEPVRYNLQPEISTVGFSYMLLGQKINGRMPVESAEIAIDFNSPSNSRVSAVMRPDQADAGPDYADTAMKGPDVLATAQYPRIVFEGAQITETTNGAKLDGNITIRDVTRPVTLDVQFFRQRGTDAGDRSRMSVVIKGVISRQAFGASGFGGLVQDRIDLTILARISRTE
jgi:polyisoprenoid-binding protein YceI